MVGGWGAAENGSVESLWQLHVLGVVKKLACCFVTAGKVDPLIPFPQMC
jgi:hypothetical protein